MKNSVFRLAAVDTAECGLFAALMVAGAFIKIPFPMVPLTFQTVIAVLAGLLLGWRKGMIAMGVYAVMGLIGIPVFSSEPFGGFSYVMKPSFGYILGFIASAGVAGIAYNSTPKLWQKICLALGAFLADYIMGIAYFIAVWELSSYGGLWSAVVSYNLVYMPKDVVLCVMAAFLAYAVTPAIRRMHGKVRDRKVMPAKEKSDK